MKNEYVIIEKINKITKIMKDNNIVVVGHKTSNMAADQIIDGMNLQLPVPINLINR